MLGMRNIISVMVLFNQLYCASISLFCYQWMDILNCIQREIPHPGDKHVNFEVMGCLIPGHQWRRQPKKVGESEPYFFAGEQ